MDGRPRKQGQLFESVKADSEFVHFFDENNLIEFPLAVLADNAPQGLKTLEFEDTIFDKSANGDLKRRCIVTGSDKWGLPNWFDIDIVLALMQITKRQNRFQDRTVYFTIGELCRELEKSGNSVKNRVKEGLLRILGTTIVYDKAWRSNGRWITTEGFHLLDNVRLSNTKEFYDPEAEQCLKWNDLVVESVQAQNTKGLDWGFYKSLKRPSAKRLYRFLDKRFGMRSWWSYQLQEFCPNKLGMTAGLPAWRYRERMSPGVAELVERGFLADQGEELFTKKGKVSYINFKRQSAKRIKMPRVVDERKPSPGGLEQELLNRGVTNPAAAQLVEEFEKETIREQIENFDDRNKNGQDLAPGFLIKGIKEGYGFRKGFKSSAQKEEEAKKRREREVKQARARAKEKREQEEQKKREAAQRDEFIALRNQYSEAEQIELEDEAMKECSSFETRFIRKDRSEGRVGLWHQNLWEKHIIPNLPKQ